MNDYSLRNWGRRTRVALGLGLIVCWAAASSRAEFKPNPLFSDNAVLQQHTKVPVWGTANDGQEITVAIQGKSAETKAANGRWQVALENLEPGGPFELTISSGEEKVVIHNVLVGEVWVASGQSNMQWAVKQSADPEHTIAESANPKLRLLTVPRQATDSPLDVADVKWDECGPETIGDFSAVAYFFGRELQSKLGVPLGLINTSYGGTPAEAWTCRAALEADPSLKPLLTQPPAQTKAPQRPTGLYNAMIHPLLPYAIQGAIWYQGESNAGRAHEYKTLFPTMIKNWRHDWGQGDFPFLFVQLAPFHKKVDQPGDSQWAELREAQRLTLDKLTNTGMAVITDVGDEEDIHPKQKEPVGKRLALAALSMAYGREIEYSGPNFKKMDVQGHDAILSFEHLGGGLVAPDNKPSGFTIAGKDQKFYPATATIKGDQVVVSSPEVSEPVAVRYGWADFPIIDLANQSGLLASPFATDDFRWTTQPK